MRQQRSLAATLATALEHDEPCQHRRARDDGRNGGRDAEHGKRAAGQGLEHTPGGHPSDAQQQQRQTTSSQTDAHAVDAHAGIGLRQLRQKASADQHSEEIQRYHAERNAKASSVQKNAERNGHESGHGRGRRHEAEGRGARMPLVQRRDEPQHRRGDEAGAQSHQKAPAPGEHVHRRGSDHHGLTEDGQRQADAQRLAPTHHHADHAARNHARTRNERVCKVRHLHIGDGGAKRTDQFLHSNAQRSVVTRRSNLSENDDDERNHGKRRGAAPFPRRLVLIVASHIGYPLAVRRPSDA